MKTHLGRLLVFAFASSGCSSGHEPDGRAAPVSTAHPTGDAATDGESFPLRDAATHHACEHDTQSPVPRDLDAAGCTPIDGKTLMGLTVGTVAGGRETFECDGTPGAPIDKTCARDEDCVVVVHRYDRCAGGRGPGLAYVGIAVRDQDCFEAAEGACEWPPRACSGGLTIAEDGTIRDATPTPGTASVSCCGGLCRATFLPHLLDAGRSVMDGGGRDGKDASGGAERDARSDAPSP